MTSRCRVLFAVSAGLFLLSCASAQTPPIRIMPLGDSITYGVGAAGGGRRSCFVCVQYPVHGDSLGLCCQAARVVAGHVAVLRKVAAVAAPQVLGRCLPPELAGSPCSFSLRLPANTSLGERPKTCRIEWLKWEESG